jgi:F-type H+-transporting ATPase subunit delta
MAESQDINAEHTRMAARIAADVSVDHIADVYARAFLDTAEKAGQTAALIEEFDAIITDVYDRYPRLKAVFYSLIVSNDEIMALLDRLFAGRVSPLLLNFLKVVARHGRMNCLRPIHRRLHLQYDQLQNHVRVRLTTASPLTAELAGRLRLVLRDKLGGEPVFDIADDPKLIGGAVLRIDDTVYDGSIANQLKILRQQMMDRSAHEIQSRRDRFRNTAGN